MADTKRRNVSSGRTGRLEKRLKLSLENGNYYEAHQSMKVLYERYISQGRTEEAWTMLLQGATQLLDKDQWESGTELALMLVTHLKDRKIPATKNIMDQIESLFKCYKFIKCDDPVPHPLLPSLRLFPSIANLSKEDAAALHSMQINRDMFMKAAIKWTNLVNGDMKYGDIRFYKLLAVTCFEEGELQMARKHFLYADMPVEFGQLLVELSEKYGHPTEVDMFITQAVLQLLVLGKKEIAIRTYNHYYQHHSLVKPFAPPPFPSHLPLLNFTWFLIHSIDIGSSEVFHSLCQSYFQVLCWDPSFHSYLEKVGEIYFGLKQRSSAPQGFMNLLMGGGGGGGGEGEGGSGGLFNSLLSSFEGGDLLSQHEQAIQPQPQVLDMNLLETAEGLD